jgi:hypothetical protein
MAVTETLETTLQADFFQFYVGTTEDWGGDDLVPDGVDGLGYEWRLWSKGRFAYVGTGGQHPVVALTVEVHDAPPGEPGPEWDHVVSTSISSDGALGLWNWDINGGPPPASVALAAGTWRLRVHWADLASSDGPDPESLMMQFWSEPWSETTLDRCWEPWAMPAPTDRSSDGRRQIEPWQGTTSDLRFEPVGGWSDPFEIRPLPGGGEVYRYDRLYRNPSEDTWWLEGREVRPVLREVTTAEAAVLMAEPDFVRIAEESLQALRDFRARSQER